MVCWRRKCYSSYIFFRCRFFVYFCKLSLKSALLQNLDSPFWILEPWVLDFYLWIALIKKEASQAKYHYKMCQFRRKIIHKLTVNCLLILLTKKTTLDYPPHHCVWKALKNVSFYNVRSTNFGHFSFLKFKCVNTWYSKYNCVKIQTRHFWWFSTTVFIKSWLHC